MCDSEHTCRCIKPETGGFLWVVVPKHVRLSEYDHATYSVKNKDTSITYYHGLKEADDERELISSEVKLTLATNKTL